MKLSNNNNQSLRRDSSIKVNSKTPILSLENIISNEGRINYSLIHTKGGSILCTKSLKYFEQNIKDARFIRPHKSHIVNRDFIVKFTRKAGNFTIGLKNGNLIDIARRRNKEILAILN